MECSTGIRTNLEKGLVSFVRQQMSCVSPGVCVCDFGSTSVISVLSHSRTAESVTLSAQVRSARDIRYQSTFIRCSSVHPLFLQAVCSDIYIYIYDSDIRFYVHICIHLYIKITKNLNYKNVIFNIKCKYKNLSHSLFSSICALN